MGKKPKLFPPVTIIAKSGRKDVLGKWVDVRRHDGLQWRIYKFSRGYNKVKSKKLGSKVRL